MVIFAIIPSNIKEKSWTLLTLLKLNFTLISNVIRILINKIFDQESTAKRLMFSSSFDVNQVLFYEKIKFTYYKNMFL